MEKRSWWLPPLPDRPREAKRNATRCSLAAEREPALLSARSLVAARVRLLAHLLEREPAPRARLLLEKKTSSSLRKRVSRSRRKSRPTPTRVQKRGKARFVSAARFFQNLALTSAPSSIEGLRRHALSL